MPPERFNASHVKNKIKREDVHRQQKRKKGQEKLKRRLALAEAERKDPEARKARVAQNKPKTLDNMREYDPSVLTSRPTHIEESGAAYENAAHVTEPSTSAAAVHIEDQNAYDISVDPFASYFSSAAVGDGEPLPPKVLITASSKSTKVAFDFCEELVGVFPGSEFIRRKKNKGFEIGRIAGWAGGRGYTSMMVVNEDRKKCNAITLIHLPSGPTAYFKLTSVQLTKEIYGHARASPHYPELILNGFVTRLGHLVGRMFQTFFPPMPEFEGRQVVTLHNQRDFLFFRRHRYMFKSSEKTALQEIGPRFTLKLRYIKKGIPAVRQLCAAPPPLAFDIEDADEEGTAPADTADPAYSADQVSHECDPSAASPPRKSVAPAKDEEYIWQWKPELETSRKTFFL